MWRVRSEMCVAYCGLQGVLNQSSKRRHKAAKVEMPNDCFRNKSHRRTEDRGGHVCENGQKRLLREGDIVSELGK